MDSIRCSFCGKPRSAVASIVAGPTPAVAICNECVDLCAEIIAEQARRLPTGIRRLISRGIRLDRYGLRMRMRRIP